MAGSKLAASPSGTGKIVYRRESHPVRRGRECAAATFPSQYADNGWSPPRPTHSRATPTAPFPPFGQSASSTRQGQSHTRPNKTPAARASHRASSFSKVFRPAHSIRSKLVAHWPVARFEQRLQIEKFRPETRKQAISRAKERKRFSWLGKDKPLELGLSVGVARRTLATRRTSARCNSRSLRRGGRGTGGPQINGGREMLRMHLTFLPRPVKEGRTGSVQVAFQHANEYSN